MPDDLPNPLSRNAHWRTLQFVLQILFCFWLRFRARGMERLPKVGGALLLVNHQSYLDPLLVGVPLQRPVSYLARDSLFRVPVIGWILRNTYVMPINREAASTSSLREAIRSAPNWYKPHAALAQLLRMTGRSTEAAAEELVTGKLTNNLQKPPS